MEIMSEMFDCKVEDLKFTRYVGLCITALMIAVSVERNNTLKVNNRNYAAMTFKEHLKLNPNLYG